MAEHTILIDVVDISIPEANHRNIPVINQPNRCYGFSANAKQVRSLIQLTRYYIYESGTDTLITGENYYDYFPEEGGGGGGGVTPEEVQAMIAASIDTAISESSDNAIANSTITNFVNSSIASATADFRGTFTSLEDLEATPANKNDYAFLQTTDTAGNTIYKRYKYTEIEDSHPLPEGYTRIAYIKSTGSEVIDTLINPSSKNPFDIKVDQITASSSSGILGSIGYIPELGTNEYFHIDANSNGATVEVDFGGYYHSFGSIDTSEPLEISYDYPKLTINGDITSITDPGDFTFSTPGTTLTLFTRHYDGDYSWKCEMRLFYFTMKDLNGDVICDLVPCRNSNDEVGMYDLINDRFLGNVGTGAFIGGPAASGTWEFEYALNNSSFTAEQWAAINSGVKSSDVTQIGTNTSNITTLQTEVGYANNALEGVL